MLFFGSNLENSRIGCIYEGCYGFNLLSSISLVLKLYYTVGFNHISIYRACASVFNSNVDTDLLCLMKLQ